MGNNKKKKGGAAAPKRDARGYGQQQQRQPQRQAASSSNSSGVSTLKVTTLTQNHLDQVLISMEEDEHPSSSSSFATATAAVGGPSDRFVKRLSNIYDRLKDSTFTDEQIGRVVSALGYGVTLEGALDYLCFLLSTSELPVLFTEGSVRDDLASASTSASLEVIAPQPLLPSSAPPPPLRLCLLCASAIHKKRPSRISPRRPF